MEHVTERFARLEAAQPVDVGGAPDRPVDRRPFALDEIEVEAHRGEGQEEIREEDRGVDVDHVDWLKRDGDGELGLAADLEQGITLPERAIVRHVPARLTHEPDGCGIDRLAPAGAEKSIVHETRVRASASRSSSQSGLKRIDAPRDFSSIWIGSDRK